MLRLTLLSISLLTVFASAAIAPALSEIAAAFPQVSATRIKSLLTAPALAMMVVSPFAGWLSHRLGSKRLLVIGLVFYIGGGLGGGLAQSFGLLFTMRLLLGVGIGILMPLSSGLVAEFFEGRERLRMMGLSSSVSSFFGVGANILVGYLALFSWRYGFAVYAIGILVLVLALTYIPLKPPAAKVAVPRARLPLAVYGWALAVFVQLMAIYAVPVNIALFMTENAIGGPRETGIALSCLTAASFFTGFLGVRVRGWLGRYFVFATLVLGALGYWLLATADSLGIAIAALLAIGFGNGFLMPYLFFCATTAVTGASVMGAMGVVGLAASLGQFATPILLDGIAHGLGDTSTRFVFQFMAVAIALAAALVLGTLRLASGRK
ncbi:MAG: MFS transporter [Porticoccaceae bacterium]